MAGLSQQARTPRNHLSIGAVNMGTTLAAAMPKYQFSCEVLPLYMPEHSAPQSDIYGFAYTVTITNTGEVAAPLISRHWIISDARGHTEEVKGLGVVGHQPLLKPGESFQYSSSSRLRTPTGTMHGSYFFVAEDGERFESAIPMFVLDAGDTAGPDNGARVLH
jgi:ApaG protein